MKRLAGISMVVLLAGCSLFGGKNTIGGLKSQQAEESNLDFSNLDHEQVRQEYKELLELVDDKYLKEQIERRIAGVSMAEGDHKQTSQARPKKGYYRDAINSYIDILEKYPNSPDNAEVLYQLSKAYEMEGEANNAEAMLNRLVTLHPYFSAIGEAHFRLGDIYFNKQDYKKAEQHYRASTQVKSDKLDLNAHYMLGWALYKRGLFDDALESFSYVLSVLLENNANVLTKNEKPLVQDTLHSISLALVNLGGPEKIQDVKGLQGKSYIWQVYENLGAYYLEKNRYADSAATYRQFIQQFPMDTRTPDMHSKLIAAYTKGAFSRDVMLAKQDYVTAYGVQSAYWQQASASVRQSIAPNLHDYLIELAGHFHAQGQQLVKLAAEKTAAQQAKEKSELDDKAKVSYGQATQYYALYLLSFPDAKDIAKQRFMKAEAHFEAGQYPAAAADYEEVSYNLKNAEYGNRAGYAAIVAYQNYVAQVAADSALKAQYQEKAVASMLRFAARYDTDERSSAVLTNAAEYLFSLNRYQQAIDISSALITNNKTLDKNLKQTAYGIMAHSYFQLQQYAQAEDNYDKQRTILGKQSPEYAAISERMAKAVYKKSEALLQSDKPAAIVQLLRIKTIAPDAEVRVVAQYDAAVTQLSEKMWAGAISELNELNRLYPKHALAKEFPRKLAYAYEQSGDIKQAAAAYTYLYKNDADAEVRREALFAAAGLFEQLEDLDTALDNYKTYAQDYEKPFDNRMEARYHIALIYARKDDATRELYWLRRIIDGDASGGDLRTDRSRWLGAWANTQYGDYFAGEFPKRSLNSFLEKNLGWKNQMLQDAVSRYQMAAEYGILEFSSQSSFKIAKLYSDFANELLAVKTPAGLGADDQAMFRTVIEEQATPMRELAVNIHSGNIELAWAGHFNQWIDNSFKALAELSPARFDKPELQVRYGDEIR
ncbi:MAG: tetratricopeptide repeat protein [Oceanospirillaceae bacterium]|nr:tetratricopeptide repeat protein [Oceanospirillaceae bacterium]MCP5334841.1 tetratricopeptide repeat protein [Oceanospirillaceae bacterium]MCP5349512.1 tetratricopeptide repeat protein [Oceanospirillaceae bacterium]